MFKPFIVGAALGALLFASPANAGGLFGDGGLIRGTIGEWGDETIDRPVTPVLQQGVVLGGAYGGAVVGQIYGVPAPIGGAAGACAGQNVNSTFGGRGFVDCSGQIVDSAVQQYVPMGNTCYTPAGAFGPGPSNPLGSSCFVMAPWGRVEGRVG